MTYTAKNIKAILFDMDGTLVDSESLTGFALLALLADRSLPSGDLDLVQFHGITWMSIAQRLGTLFPDLADQERHLASEIEDRFQLLFESTPPELIPGARQAFAAAAASFPQNTTIVTSSEARAVEVLLDHADLRALCTGYTSCDQYKKSKPDPQSYLMAAARLGVNPTTCLVFEDSHPGLLAARAAGMHCLAITRRVAVRIQLAEELADGSIDDYHNLPEGFFAAAAGAEA